MIAVVLALTPEDCRSQWIHCRIRGGISLCLEKLQRPEESQRRERGARSEERDDRGDWVEVSTAAIGIADG